MSGIDLDVIVLALHWPRFGCRCRKTCGWQLVDIASPASARERAAGSLDGTAGREAVRPVDSCNATLSRGPRDRDPDMTIECIHRISITAMVLLLVVAAAAAQTTSKPLYVDRVQRVAATFYRMSEGSLPVNGSMESFFEASTQRFRGWSGQTSS